MKKLFALMMAVALMLTAMSSALAYTAVTPAETLQSAITHTLKLSDPEATGLAYEITYTFTVETSSLTVMQPEDVINADYAVTGSPKIDPITYNSASTFSADNKSCTQPLKIDWSGVTIKEPGVYRWQVNKTWKDTDTSADPTNNSETMYLYAYANVNGGSLQVVSVGMTSKAELNGGADTKGNLEDQYPAQLLNLSISKMVDGNQGSQNQYFKFTVQLTSPAGAAKQTYNIEGLTASVPETAYHTAQPNPETVTVDSVNGGTVELWLRHDQTAKIENLLYGTAYTITEYENAGYTVTSAITGDTTDTKAEGATASDTSLTASTTVAFTNTKNATVPTGIELHTSAAIMGILLAAGLMMLMLIGKRKAVTE